MDFVRATNILTARVTQADLAEELGVAMNTVNRARLDPASAHARTAPDGWEAAVVKLARKRAADLVKLADQLDREP